MNAVEVQDLSFAYEPGHPILKHLNFSVEKGTAVVFAGLSGSGKTTLCRCLCGIIPSTVRGTFCGQVRVDGCTVSELPLYESAQHIALVFQNPDDQLICSTVEDELAFALENLCVPADEIRRRVDAALARFGLSELALTDPAKLSGGQKKLVTIVSVLLMGPEVVILDEPMTGLDAPSRALVLDTIAQLRQDGCTILAVEHDLSLTGYADRILYLRDGMLYDTP